MGNFAGTLSAIASRRAYSVRGVALPVLLFGVAALLWSVTAMATQTLADKGFKIAPGVVLLPSFGAGFTYTNNFYYQPNDEHTENAAGIQIKPGLTLLGNAGRYKFQVNAGLTAAKFGAVEAADDYLDHAVNGQFSWGLTALSTLIFTASHKRGHDALGLERTGTAAGFEGDADEWGRYGAGVVYSYGAPGSRLGLNLGYRVMGLNYKTNRYLPSGFGTRFLDYNTQTVSIAGLYHYSGKTTFVVSYQHTDIDVPNEFPKPFVQRSGDTGLYLVGVQWQATGQTSGDARVGYIHRGFDDPRLDSFGKFAWQIGVNWSPIARAQFRLETGRTPQASYYLRSGFIDNRYYGIEATYDWTARFKTVFDYRYTKQEFVGSRRDDDLNHLSLTGKYILTKLWDLVLKVASSHRDSNLIGADFDRTRVLVGFRYAL